MPRNKKSQYSYGVPFACLDSKKPFSVVSTDVLGPFSNVVFVKEQSFTNFYFISLIDNCTRYGQVSFTTKSTGTEITSAFQN